MFFNYFFGGMGINMLVLFLYAIKSGFLCIFFSSIGIPDTFVIKKVIVNGPIIVKAP